MRDAGHALLDVTGKDGAELGEAGVGGERNDGGEGGDGEAAVVELDERGVLEHVAPPQVRLVGRVAVEGVEELLLRRRQAQAHPRELVVDQAGVEAGDERAGHGGDEDEGSEGGDVALEGA